MEPRGRAGWLALFIFMLIASTLTVVSKSLTPIFEAESLGAVWPAGFKTVYLSSVLLPAGVLGFAAWMLIRHSDWYAVTIAIRSMWVGGLGSVLAPTLVLNSYLPQIKASQEALLPTVSTLIWLTIWTGYLLKSRRVKNTYPLGAPIRIEPVNSKDSSLRNIFDSSPQSQQQRTSDVRNGSSNQKTKKDFETMTASFRFVIFRADADGKWYWALQNTPQNLTIARSNGCLTRSECLNNITILFTITQETPIWDKTSNEYVSPNSGKNEA